MQKSTRFWFSIYGFTAVIMTIAVAVFAWLASESRKEAGEGRTANAHPPVRQHIPAERLELLARFDAPLYSPAAADPPPFQQAMRSYANRDYARAIPELRALTESRPDLAGARFYLAICLLLTNDRASGIQQLRGVIAAPSSSFVESAHFYLAKALLSAGDATSAEKELEAAIAMHGEMEQQAHVLLGQIR